MAELLIPAAELVGEGAAVAAPAVVAETAAAATGITEAASAGAAASGAAVAKTIAEIGAAATGILAGVAAFTDQSIDAVSRSIDLNRKVKGLPPLEPNSNDRPPMPSEIGVIGSGRPEYIILNISKIWFITIIIIILIILYYFFGEAAENIVGWTILLIVAEKLTSAWLLS